LFECETATVEAVGSWQCEIDGGASGNIHNKHDYKKNADK
jgi:hypothetical protein